MDSVIMTTPASGNRLRSRLRSGMNAMCARNTKQMNHHTYPKISSSHHGQHPNGVVNGHNGIRRESARPAFHKSGSFCSSRLDVAPICDAKGAPTVFENGGKKADPEIVKNASAGSRLNGKMSREALQAWSERVGPRARRAPADTVQPLFNDLHLYPTKMQVFEMLVCARQCARRSGLSLSFGEFCVFAAELRRRAGGRRTSSSKSDSVSESPVVKPVVPKSGELCNQLKNCSENGTGPEPAHPYEVFLGGSCNPTTWRWDVAIPTLEKMGITFFNPQVADWSLELIEIEHRAKQSAKVLFFVLDAETRAAAAAVEAAHLAANTRPLVLVLQPYKRGQRIGDEVVSDQEYLDLSRGQALLQEVAERRALPVFTELRAALERTQHLLRGETLKRPAQIPAIANHLIKLKREFDAADEHGSGSLTPNQTLIAIKAFSGMDLTLERLEDLVQACALSKGNESWGQEIPRSSSATNGISLAASFNGEQRQLVDFELFCSILAEVMAEAGYTGDMTKPSTPITDSEHRIKVLMRSEAKQLLDSLETEPHELRTPPRDLSKFEDVRNVNPPACDGELIEIVHCDNHSKVADNSRTRWRPGSVRWRQLLGCVHEAILGLVSKIEFNSSSRSTNQSTESAKNGHPNLSTQTSVKNGGSSSPTVVVSSKVNVSTSYSRRREQDWKFKQNRMSTESAEQSDDSSHSSKEGTTPTSASSTKPARKLSVFIPKLTVTNGSFDSSENDALTPQTSKRLDGLAEQVRDEPVALRDVYLGGSCPLRSNWRTDMVIPLLQKNNLSFYAPAMNDYSRMFSAPPYTPASDARFTFENPTSLRTPTRSQDYSSSFTLKRDSSTKQVTARDSTVAYSRSSSDVSTFAASNDHLNEIETKQTTFMSRKNIKTPGAAVNMSAVEINRLKGSTAFSPGTIGQNISNPWNMSINERNKQSLSELNDNVSHNINRLQNSEEKSFNSSRLMKSKSVDESSSILKDSTRENSSDVSFFRSLHKHERSPARDNSQPEKRPKYSSEPAGISPSRVDGNKDLNSEVEIRQKNDGPYSLQSGGDNRLSASDFYRIPENASPAPFRGMFDDRQVLGSRVLLFGVTSDTRCLAPMVLAAHCIGLRRKSVVLCVQLLQQAEGLSERAVKDYNRGRLYLIDLAKREGVPVFDNLEAATACVIKKLQDGDY